MLLQFNLLTTSDLLQITEFGTSYFKVFRKIVSVPNNHHCNLNSKFNHSFHSLNVTKCTLGCQYISVTLYLLQTYPLENHCSKAKVLLTLQTCTNYEVYKRKSVHYFQNNILIHPMQLISRPCHFLPIYFTKKITTMVWLQKHLVNVKKLVKCCNRFEEGSDHFTKIMQWRIFDFSCFKQLIVWQECS